MVKAWTWKESADGCVPFGGSVQDTPTVQEPPEQPPAVAVTAVGVGGPVGG